MSASPELRRSPIEALPRPISTTHIAVHDDECPHPAADDEDCRTPTASNCKIPAMTTCPPAPKKARLKAPTCRRRLLDAEHIIRILPEDVERLFRPPAPLPGGQGLLPAKKRKRRDFEDL